MSSPIVEFGKPVLCDRCGSNMWSHPSEFAVKLLGGNSKYLLICEGCGSLRYIEELRATQ